MNTYSTSKKPIDVVRWQKNTKPTRKELTDILDAEGLEWAEFADAPGTKWGRHKHDFDDFVVIVTGQMKLGIGHHEWTLTAGDRIDLPAHTVHWAEIVGKKEARYLSAAK